MQTRNFYSLLGANFFVSLAVFVFLFSIIEYNESFDSYPLAFAAGAIIPGPFSAYLLDRYRRPTVAITSVVALLGIYVLMCYGCLSLLAIDAFGLLQGVMFSLFEIAVGSTLIIDLVKSEKRTKSNYLYAWIGRLALVTSPIIAYILLRCVCLDINQVELMCIAFSAIGIAMVASAKVPFRAPLEPSLLSLDRFFLPKAFPIAVNWFLVSVVIGIFMGLYMQYFPVHDDMDAARVVKIGILLCPLTGCVIAVIAKTVVFTRTEHVEELVAGMIMLIASMLLLCTYQDVDAMRFSAGMFGIGIGLTASRFLLNMISVAEHCKRAAANTSFFIFGIVGFCLGVTFAQFDIYYSSMGGLPRLVGLLLLVVSLLMYVFFTKKWYIKYKRK